MSITIDQIDSSDKVTDGDFTGSTGTVNPFTRGVIFENDKIVSCSFGYSPSYTPDENQIIQFCTNSEEDMTTCFEGPLIKLWWDSEDKQHLSTTNKINCINSYWGNKKEKFGDLFFNNGGKEFSENCVHDLTHHFMIMTPSLMVTCDLDLKNNNCVVVYLGSMTKDGHYTNVYNEKVFYKQTCNTIPTKEELEGKILFPYVWKFDDTDQYTNFVDKVLKYGYTDHPSIVAPLSQTEKFNGVDMKVIESYFGSPIIFRSINGIVKFVPASYDKKCGIIGNTPNIKLLVYNLMDKCRMKKDMVLDYFETYDFLFVPEREFIDNLKTSKNVKIDIISKYRELGTIGFMEAKKPKNNDARERNLMLILLLCLPQYKAIEAINAYENYLQCQKKLKAFITANLKQIIEGKYDESFENEKVISRMKDICSRSSDYADKNSKKSDYDQKFEFSLKGLIVNERGASLYKINKALEKFV